MEKIQTTLIIPALNEEGSISKTIKEIPSDAVDEIIVIDGHSTDNTVSEASQAIGQRGKVITQQRDGFGGALFDGVEAARGDVIIIMDADGSHNPNDIPEILSKFSENTLVMASRYAKGGRSDDDTSIRRLGNWIFTKLINIVHGVKVTDSLYLFSAISRENFKKLDLKNHGFGVCIEFLVKAKKIGLHFEEIPVVERSRLSGESKVNEFRDGLKILRMILKKY